MKQTAQLIDVIRRLSPRCKEAARVISDSAQQRSGLLDRTGVLLHVLICTPCRRYRQSVRFLTMKMKQIAELPATDAAHAIGPEARARIRNVLERVRSEPSTDQNSS
jgi:hypothetical protein